MIPVVKAGQIRLISSERCRQTAQYTPEEKAYTVILKEEV